MPITFRKCASHISPTSTSHKVTCLTQWLVTGVHHEVFAEEDLEKYRLSSVVSSAGVAKVYPYTHAHANPRTSMNLAATRYVPSLRTF
eukprot:429222-Amphidinium_carterae.1